MFWLIPLICGSFMLPRAISEEDSKLLLVQTLFRHGDRSPRNLYPKDPNSVDSWPEGLGKLTLTGKRQQYALGKFLRSRYRHFITTNPNEVLVNSSATPRCLTSAAANLAGFYAPEGKWKMDDGLNWQPIPIHYLPPEQDKYLSFLGTCPRVKAEMKRRRDSEEMKQLFRKYQAKLQQVSNYTGIDISKSTDVFNLYDTLRVEKIHKLIIPEWVDFYWEDIKGMSDSVFYSFSNSPLVLRLRVGPLLQYINRNMEKKIKGDIPDLKVQMFSAHDINVAAVLLALNFTNMPRPPYCATVLFELHQMSDNSTAVRLLYLNSTDPIADIGEPHVLKLDGCSEFCPVENFTKRIQHLIPDDWDQECQFGTGMTLRSSFLLCFLLLYIHLYTFLIN